MTKIPAPINSVILCIALLFLGACATIDQNHEKPKVDVVGIHKSETDTAALQFTLELRIVNPNATPLNLKGLYYELNIEGIDLITGTARNIPTIEGYSDTVISVNSAAGMISSIRMANLMINEPRDTWRYSLKTKLGTSSRWIPSTTIVETGEISLK
ncbi:MAG: LEA type 2 family protein [Opitutaceae bacterium]